MPCAPPLDAAPFALRPFAESDRALYVGLFTDDEVMRQVGAPFPPDRAARAAAASVRHQGEGEGRFRHWVIEHREGIAGLLGLALRSAHWSGGEAEIGVLLWPAARGRGAGSAAFAAVIPWAFGVAGLGTLTCHHAGGNTAMAALARRSGFTPTAPRAGVPLPEAWERRRDAPGLLG